VHFSNQQFRDELLVFLGHCLGTGGGCGCGDTCRIGISVNIGVGADDILTRRNHWVLA
jgi:hypothetical protein